MSFFTFTKLGYQILSCLTKSDVRVCKFTESYVFLKMDVSHPDSKRNYPRIFFDFCKILHNDDSKSVATVVIFLTKNRSFYHILPQFISFYLNWPQFISFCQNQFTSFYYILPHFTTFYLILPHFTSFYLIWLIPKINRNPYASPLNN